MSSLRAQLNTLAAEENKTIALGKSKTVSILFDLRSAANVSIDKIHELALEVISLKSIFQIHFF